jgi:ABC-type transport system substrate-binding protein
MENKHMNNAIKKCPMCAEQIPLAAVTCEYCDAQFKVTSTGYCQNCHQVREADGNDQCKVCGNAVMDLHVESKLIEEPAQKPPPVSQTIAQTEITKTGKGRLPIGILVGILIFAVIGAVAWFGRNNLPAASILFATVTPTATQTYTPTITPVSSPTNTAEPTSDVVVPIDKMASSIPWLPLDPSALPGTIWVGFNIDKPPFNNTLVRQAFAAALDRQTLAKIAKEHSGENTTPATSFVPPETLGRNLYEKVGIPFDPDRARELLSQAGYANGTTFPIVTIYTQSTDIYVPLFNAIVQMWEENLNISINVKFVEIQSDYMDMLLNSNPPSVYRFGWYADTINDPDNFLKLFHSGSEWNISGWSNSKFDQLIEDAAQSSDPEKRQELYIAAERVLCEEEVLIIPLYHFTVVK